MKRLLLLRHAKSDWSEDDLDDHARPLNARGRAAATRMGQYLKENGLSPDLVVCSTANRTRETLDLLLSAHGCTPTVIYDRGIYLAMPEQMLDITLGHADHLAQAPGTADPDCILVVGHNPGTHSLAVGLARSGDSQTINTLQHKYPTAALTVLECDSDDWSDIVEAGCLKAFVMPRTLPDAS